ncbi:MAG TPA: molecular chaperone HtpG, partial [Chromatiales bacterium]|nr:molecular chaperone HtpG [Chromatiales bacterium]
RGTEVLLLADAIDEWLLPHMDSFEGRPIRNITREDVRPEGEAPKADEADADLLERIKKALEGRVKEVRTSTRLVESPACVVLGEHDLPQNLRRLYREAGQPLPETLPILEVNADHALLQRLKTETDEARIADWSGLLLGMALLAEGAQLEDGAAFVQQLNRLLLASRGAS